MVAWLRKIHENNCFRTGGIPAKQNVNTSSKIPNEPKVVCFRVEILAFEKWKFEKKISKKCFNKLKT